MDEYAKVRIYDLSKELNLDNKDILDICDQLNIEYKSHSSTISEEDAQRIKAIARRDWPRVPVKIARVSENRLVLPKKKTKDFSPA